MFICPIYICSLYVQRINLYKCMPCFETTFRDCFTRHSRNDSSAYYWSDYVVVYFAWTAVHLTPPTIIRPSVTSVSHKVYIVSKTMKHLVVIFILIRPRRWCLLDWVTLLGEILVRLAGKFTFLGIFVC